MRIFRRNITPTVAASPPLWSANTANKDKLTFEDAKFIFAQAEKMLNDSVANSNTIVERTSTLITLLTGALVGFIGFVISHLNANIIDSLMFTACVGILYSYIWIFYSFENTKPKVYLIPGSLPKDLFADAFFVNGIGDEKRIIHFYVSEIENYQFRIEKNNELNKIRWYRYKITLKAVLALPAILLICYFFT